jgi:hypothetical protein
MALSQNRFTLLRTMKTFSMHGVIAKPFHTFAHHENLFEAWRYRKTVSHFCAP